MISCTLGDKKYTIDFRAWKAKQAKEKEAPRQRYIDEVWPRVVP